MPRRTEDSVSAYERLRQQAVSALNQIRKGIRDAELELVTLRKQEEQLGQIIGEKPAARATSVSDGAGAAEPQGRTDWRAVLEKLPKRFKASDVRKVRGLANKRSGEIFAAVTRWIDGGMVKRKERGVYERVG
ncbi:MAG: hypothetical protein ACLQU2_34270 [Candidatus Binataceae bacterium]